jgi:light-regulated signal transduction histidine kinase (bacteriophytochrome)
MIENTRLKKRISIDSINKRLSTGKTLMDSIDSYLDQMRTEEMRLLSERRERKKHSELLLPRYSQIAFIIAVLLTLVFGLWIFVELKKRFRYQHLLQVKLTELRQNNEELEQIAFAASHDLQEPLRKIRIFSDRLLLKTRDKAGEEEYMMIQRMNFAAARLQDLIGDLVIFNNLVQNRYGLHPVSVKKILEESIMEVKKVYPDITINLNLSEELPIVSATEEQVKILFHQVISNSIQFKSPDNPLVISIQSSRVPWLKIRGLPSEMNDGYFCQLSIKDNGIGFDESFKGKMFKPFQRLHNVETVNNTRRKGMGLAMCKRVMLNVGGWIDAEGKVGEGATILLYFPLT